MKILIAGGCGFIGSHVAYRFHKEGHSIFIIDNLSAGNTKNVEIPHKFYNLDISSKDCEEVFKSHKFDIVINLAAQIDVSTSFESPFIDSKTNLLGLTNLLDLSAKYKVRKFIFASSSAVYGNNTNLPLTEESALNPISPYGMSKMVGEFYCKKWSELFGLKTVCLRLSSVFGPKQSLKGESSVIPVFINKILNNEKIVIFGDGNQTRDFIYVDDAVDAIYKSIETDVEGIINVSFNHERSINELVDVLKLNHNIPGITYKNNTKASITRSVLDNSKLRKLLHWNAKHSFNSAIEKTYDWYKNSLENIDDTTTEAKIAEKVSFSNSIFFKMLPYFENFLGILVVIFLNNLLFKNSNSIFNNSLDICYIYIVAMASMYGMKQGFLSIILSSMLNICTLVNSGISIANIFYEPKYLINIIFYILIGSIVSYAIDLKNNKIYENGLELAALNEKYNFLQMIYTDTRIIKEELQDQIISSEDSFANIYETTKALDSLEVDYVYSGAVKAIETLLKTPKVSIFSVNKTGEYLRLKAKSTSDKFTLPFSVKVAEFEELKNVIVNKTIFINRSLNSKLPKMTAPIIDRDKVVALVSIHEFEFENFTLYYENLFQVMVNLISSAITRAYRYDEATVKDKFIPGTEILVNKEFQHSLKQKLQLKESFNLEFSLVKTKESYSSYDKLSTYIRDTDLLGLGKDNCIYILLSNTDKIAAKKALSRFLSNGIDAELIEGVSENV